MREVLLDRFDSGSRPLARNDSHKVVLAVEGGGMRGAVASGMLLALEQLGFRDTFDVVVGTSAGAIAGAYFVAGQGTKGTTLYYTVLNSDRFVNRRRLLKGEPVLDLDYLLGEAFDAHGFVWNDLLTSDVPLFATITPVQPPTERSVDSRRPVENREVRKIDGTTEHAKAVLAASAALPVLAGGSRCVDGEEFVDGGMLEPVPWLTALELGATHVLAVRSRDYNDDGKPEPLSLLERSTVPRLAKRMHGDYVSCLVRDHAELFAANTESLRSISDGSGSAWPPLGSLAAKIETVVPAPDTVLPERLEVDTNLLMDALAGGARAMLQYFDLDGFEVEQRVVISHPRAPIGTMRNSALSPIVRSRRSTPRA